MNIQKRKRKHDLSPSSMGMYNKCPKQYWFNYISQEHKKQRKATIEMINGTRAHTVLERAVMNERDARRQGKAIC